MLCLTSQFLSLAAGSSLVSFDKLRHIFRKLPLPCICASGPNEELVFCFVFNSHVCVSPTTSFMSLFGSVVKAQNKHSPCGALSQHLIVLSPFGWTSAVSVKPQFIESHKLFLRLALLIPFYSIILIAKETRSSACYRAIISCEPGSSIQGAKTCKCTIKKGSAQ